MNEQDFLKQVYIPHRIIICHTGIVILSLEDYLFTVVKSDLFAIQFNESFLDKNST